MSAPLGSCQRIQPPQLLLSGEQWAFHNFTRLALKKCYQNRIKQRKQAKAERGQHLPLPEGAAMLPNPSPLKLWCTTKALKTRNIQCVQDCEKTPSKIRPQSGGSQIKSYLQEFIPTFPALTICKRL